MSAVDVLARIEAHMGPHSETLAAVAELIEAAGLRVEWVNGTWYVLTASGAAFSNIGHNNEVLARTEAADALHAALARVKGGAA